MNCESERSRNRAADWRFVRCGTVAALVVLCTTALVHAQGLVYVDAISWDYGYPPANIYKSDGSEMHQPSDGLDPFQSVAGDNLWGWRDFGVPYGGYNTVFESVEEDCPEVMVKLSGLNPSTDYDVYVVYWSDQSNWNIRAGFTRNPGANQAFDRTGAGDAIAGTYASSAAWTTPPENSIPTIDPNTNDIYPSPFISVSESAPEFARDMYLGLIGTQTSTASGRIDVYLDDLPGNDLFHRSWIEGLAYVEHVPEPGTLALLAMGGVMAWCAARTRRRRTEA